ncbi:putative secondary metabolism biosynthetic enzyme [Botryosphaeria dothidea]
MASYFVTGSSRGIGLTLVTILLSKPTSEVSKIFASARSETDSVKKLITNSNGRVVFVPLDVTSEESIKSAASHVSQAQGSSGIDVLVNNAGISSASFSAVEDMTDLDDIFKVNVGGVHNVTRAFLPVLKKGNLKKIINISSTLGSITKADAYMHMRNPSYKISKAALNMLTVQYSISLKKEGFTVIAISPGWLKTDLGSQAADLEPEQGANATLDIVSRATSADTGKFFNINVPGWDKYDGSCPPW